jgi:hypothetical protein
MLQFKDLTDYNAITWPVTHDEGATWLRTDSTEDRELIEDLIKAATIQAEDLAGQDFMPRTYEVATDTNVTSIDLEKWPFGEIVSVTAVLNDTDTVLALNTGYKLKQYQWGAKVEIQGTLEADYIKVRYKTAPNSGYLLFAKVAIKLAVAKWYDQRASGKHEWPESAEAMMMNIRIRRL